MTPARAIAMLDRQIKADGEPVTLKRQAAVQTVVAFVRGYRPDELVGGINQGDTLVTLSPTGLNRGSFAASLPKRGDQVVIEGRVRIVETADPVRLAGEVVRINLQVRG